MAEKYSSFDIFDTVLTRRLSCPVDVFEILGERLKKEGIRVPPYGMFRTLRIRCERWSRRFQPSYEVLLTDIYELLGKLLLWTPEQRLRASEIEKGIEAEMLHATPFGLSAVKKAREQGNIVVFVSDMYLDSCFLKMILMREGVAQADELVAVSGEWKASKAGKKIWPLLLEKLTISSEQLFHQGDHPHSDVESPATFGIPSQRIGTSVVSRWEQWQPRQSPLSSEDWGRVAALSRMARAMTSQVDDYSTMFGSGVLGPWVMGFAVWTIAQAKERGLKTLWFLSRDAWWFFQAARRLPDAAGLDLRYVAINRNLLRVATEGVRPQKEWFTGSRRVTWDLLQQRWQMTEKDIGELRLLVGDVGDQLSDVVDTNTQQALIDVLESSCWQQILKARALESGERVRRYLEHCALGSSAIGLVDVGWHGRSQDMLRELCPAIERGFYLGLCNQEAQAEKHAWLFDTGKAEGALFLNQHQRMLEVFLGGVCGPLLGYQRQEGRWVPRFSSSHDKEVTPGLDEMHQAATCFMELAANEKYRSWCDAEALRTFTIKQLERLLDNPSKSDAQFFGQWEVTTDDGHQDLVSPAKGFDRQRFLACWRGEQPWALLWPEASYQNSRPFWRWIMKTAWQVRERLAELRKKLA